MTTYVNQDISWYVDSLQVACHAKTATFNTTVAPIDVTALCTTGWTSAIGGLKSGTFALELMADFEGGQATGLVDGDGAPMVADAGGPDAKFFALLGAPNTVQSMSIGSADGSPAYLWRGLQTSYTPATGNVGDLAMASVSGSGSGPVVRGKLLHPGNVVRSSSGSGTGRQLGAVASGKAVYASLHVVSLAGSTPSLTVKVQSDDNAGFTSATDRVTFSAATAVGSQWGAALGAIADDYWRVVWTISGSSSPGFIFAVHVGII